MLACLLPRQSVCLINCSVVDVALVVVVVIVDVVVVSGVTMFSCCCYRCCPYGCCCGCVVDVVDLFLLSLSSTWL